MHKVSSLQKRILDYIGIFIKKRGRTPSLREIALRLGVSKSRVQFNVGRLRKMEFIRREHYARNVTILWRETNYGISAAESEITTNIPGEIILRENHPEYVCCRDDPVFEMNDDFFHTRGIRKYDLVVVSKEDLPATGNYVVIKIYGKFFLRIYSAVSYPPYPRSIHHIWYNPLELPDAELIGKVLFSERSFF